MSNEIVQELMGEARAQKEAKADEEQRTAHIVEAVLRSQAKHASVPPATNGNGTLRTLKVFGAVVGLVIAVFGPVLAVTWSASERASRLDSACESIREIKTDLGTVQTDLRDLRNAVMRLLPRTTTELLRPDVARGPAMQAPANGTMAP